MSIHYYFKVFVPSLNRRISFREISVRDLININKSIMNNDYEEVVECFDHIIDQCCIEQGLMFTLYDKIIILLNIRSFSVSNFCEITIKDNNEDKEFKHTLEINLLLQKLYALPIVHSKSFNLGELEYVYGIPLHPLKNANVLPPAEFMHCVKSKGEILVGHNATKEEFQEIINNTSVELSVHIRSYAEELYSIFNNNPLYVVRSPFDSTRELVNQSMSLDFSLYELIKMLFTENLHNLYRSIYNFNQALHISPQYTENLVPVEKDVIWSYHVKDQKDAEASKTLNTKSGNFMP